MIQGFLFDLDGTLVDTHRANYEAYKRALAEFGVEVTYEQFARGIGHQARTFLPWLAPGLEQADYEKIAELKADYYEESMHLTVANAHLITFLRAMKPAHKTVLVTTAKRKNAQLVLRYHGIEDAFDVIVTSEDVHASKPSPECYALALHRIGLKPEEAIAFEDSDPGAEAAEAAGIAVVRIGGFSQ